CLRTGRRRVLRDRWRRDRPAGVRGLHGAWLLVDAAHGWSAAGAPAGGPGVSVLLAYPVFLLLGLLLASGVFVAVSAQPLGRPGLDPITRIRRLDPDLLRDYDLEASATHSSLSGMLQPLRQDALRLATFISERLGLGLTPRQVSLLDGTDSLADHYLQRL